MELEDRELTERMKRIERLLSRQLSTGKPGDGALQAETEMAALLRTDAPHGQRATGHRPAFDLRSRCRQPRRLSVVGIWAAWIFALVGAAGWLTGAASEAGIPAATAVIGAGWAIPVQAAGSCLLLLGLLAAISGASSASRRIQQRLDSLDVATSDLRTAAAYRNAATATNAFYADLARGVSPHMLLADIKGQLDQLSVRILADAQQ